jgi:hypothetical protein
VADRQPAVLLLLGYADGLAADRRGHDGADGVGGVRGLPEEGWILQGVRLRKSVLRVTTLNVVACLKPAVKHLVEFWCHSVIVKLVAAQL